uniref:CKLF-like MARVEL transmembrane domain containing 7 n=1 Tax=Oryzias latipes TaxID=8090 RepID=A0A3P9JGK5_ORYLA
MSHSVVTTTTVPSSGDGFLNAGYTWTIPGMLKLGQLLALLIAFLCVHCAYGWPSWYAFQFFEVVALWFFVALLIFFLMHLFRLQIRVPCINWPLTEFFHYSVGAVLIFIASIAAAVKAGGVSALIVASVFGFITTFLMAVNLWTSYSVACSPQVGARPQNPPLTDVAVPQRTTGGWFQKGALSQGAVTQSLFRTNPVWLNSVRPTGSVCDKVGGASKGRVLTIFKIKAHIAAAESSLALC